jgi:hypothetical protein
MVVATATPNKKGAQKWAMALIDKALRGVIAPEEIMVATMLALSWKPFRKSKTKATPIEAYSNSKRSYPSFQNT